jgi:hypothetical protein
VRKYIFHIKKAFFFAICNLLFLGSCDRIFLDVSGKEADLQGKWQMNDADTVYYNFQKSLFQYQVYLEKDEISYAHGYYVLHGDSAIDLELLGGYTSFPLEILGWQPTNANSVSKGFKIKKLTNKELILSSDNEILSFHKF